MGEGGTIPRGCSLGACLLSSKEWLRWNKLLLCLTYHARRVTVWFIMERAFNRENIQGVKPTLHSLRVEVKIKWKDELFMILSDGR